PRFTLTWTRSGAISIETPRLFGGRKYANPQSEDGHDYRLRFASRRDPVPRRGVLQRLGPTGPPRPPEHRGRPRDPKLLGEQRFLERLVERRHLEQLRLVVVVVVERRDPHDGGLRRQRHPRPHEHSG